MVKYSWVFIFNFYDIFEFQFLLFIFSFCNNLKLSFVAYITEDFIYSIKAKTVGKFEAIYSETIHHTVISNVINHESLFEKICKQIHIWPLQKRHDFIDFRMRDYKRILISAF